MALEELTARPSGEFLASDAPKPSDTDKFVGGVGRAFDPLATGMRADGPTFGRVGEAAEAGILLAAGGDGPKFTPYRATLVRHRRAARLGR